jgi:hypothetical protein
MNLVRYLLIVTGFLTINLLCRGQKADTVSHLFPPADSVHHKGHFKSPYAPDSLAQKRHDPRKATIRSAIIPGWGQIYNHKFWKLPIVYAAIGIPAYTFFWNRSSYNQYQQAISIIDSYAQQGITPVPDSVIAKLPTYVGYLVSYGDENSLRTYRNEYRKDEDYSILFFLLAWGLNVVDATVDAHLMYFDVSDQLSMHLAQPSPGFMAPGAGAAGISLIFDLHKPRFKPLSFEK